MQNKTSNELSLAGYENLVYIYTNARLAWERVDRDSVAWFLMNMMPEDFEHK